MKKEREIQISEEQVDSHATFWSGTGKLTALTNKISRQFPTIGRSNNRKAATMYNVDGEYYFDGTLTNYELVFMIVSWYLVVIILAMWKHSQTPFILQMFCNFRNIMMEKLDSKRIYTSLYFIYFIIRTVQITVSNIYQD